MICPHCKTIHHVCPKCGENAVDSRTRPARKYEVYTCPNWHRWHEWEGEVIDLKARRAA